MSDRRTTTVVIYNGGDLDRIAELHQKAENARRRYDKAQRDGTLKMGDESPADAEAEHDAFVAEAEERATVVRLTALGRRQWRALVDENEPRRVLRTIDGAKQEVVRDDDAEYGVNVATFPDKLLTYVDPTRPDMRTITEPEFPTSAALNDWLDDLAGGDFLRLWVTAYFLNGEPAIDPKATTYSPASPTSSGTSD